MTLATACPKPAKATDSEKRVQALVKAWGRKDRWRSKAIANAKGKPRTKVKSINPRATKRRHERYTKLIRSDFNLRLRYAAWDRSNGLCECETCAYWRGADCLSLLSIVTDMAQEAEINAAFTPPAVWFTKGGTEPHKRFRSTEGQLHHLPRGYTLTERESPEAIKHVRWMWKGCHERIESALGTRRRFLKS